MKNRFTLAAFALILGVTTLFCGCSQTVQMTTVFADGSRSFNYTIQLDPTLCAMNGINYLQAMELIHNNVNDTWTEISADRNKNGVNFQAKIDTKNENTYTIAWTFDSFKSYLDFFKISTEELENQPVNIKKGLFVSQRIILDTKMQNAQDLAKESLIPVTLSNNLINAFASNFFSGDTDKVIALFSQVKVNLVKVFPSQLKIKSNAQKTQQILGNAGIKNSKEQAYYTAHLWECTLANPTPYMFMYSNIYTNANRTDWYILAIGSALIFGLILLLIFSIKSKNKKEENILNAQELLKKVEQKERQENAENSAENQDIDIKIQNEITSAITQISEENADKNNENLTEIIEENNLKNEKIEPEKQQEKIDKIKEPKNESTALNPTLDLQKTDAKKIENSAKNTEKKPQENTENLDKENSTKTTKNTQGKKD